MLSVMVDGVDVSMGILVPSNFFMQMALKVEQITLRQLLYNFVSLLLVAKTLFGILIANHIYLKLYNK
jgi:hypothetical protein